MDKPALVRPTPPPALNPELRSPGTVKARTNYRWVICGLLFFATTINYMDRQIIGVLKPLIEKDLHWDEKDYGNIVSAFQFSYAFGQLLAGRFMDLFGVRVGYAIAVAGWSLFAMGHGLGRSARGFIFARLGLGITEGGNFPGAIKTVADYFPRHERSLATGLFNSGSNIGAFLTPLIVPFLALRWGWPSAFYFVGSLGLLWVVLWLALYRRPEENPRVSPGELALIRQDESDEPAGAEALGKEPFWAIAGRRSTIAYVVASMMTGPVWWFWLFWAPDFFSKKFNLDLRNIGLPLALVYLIGDGGSIIGGWLATYLMKRGWSLNAARKTAMLICAVSVMPVFFASRTSNEWIAVLLIGLAGARHQGWSANLYTIVSDTNPRRSVSTIVGLGGLMGGLAGVVVAQAVGRILEAGYGYNGLLLTASVMYVIALAVVQTLIPKLRR